MMSKLMVLVGATVGGWLCWFAGERFGFMTAFMVSMVGTGVGIYVARRWASNYLP
jgi:uncharacterized membrane protein YeaQ/YmgE (transglycosylase-associated protein family)